MRATYTPFRANESLHVIVARDISGDVNITRHEMTAGAITVREICNMPEWKLKRNCQRIRRRWSGREIDKAAYLCTFADEGKCLATGTHKPPSPWLALLAWDGYVSCLPRKAAKRGAKRGCQGDGRSDGRNERTTAVAIARIPAIVTRREPTCRRLFTRMLCRLG